MNDLNHIIRVVRRRCIEQLILYLRNFLPQKESSMVKQYDRNCFIDIFRFICSILVIGMHTRPFEELNTGISFIFVDILARIAVPYFFALSGYYHFKKEEKGVTQFKPYLKRLLSIYCLWSCLYYFIDYATWGYADTKAFLANCIVSFFYYGSNYHFWFFPALIYSLCISVFAQKHHGERLLLITSFGLYTIGTIGCAYYNIAKDIPVFNYLYSHPQFDNIRRLLLMGLPFLSVVI